MVYKVLITEVQRMTIEIEAESPDEARAKVEADHWNGKYNLDETEDRECKYEVIDYDCPECGGRMLPYIIGDREDFDNPDGYYCEKCGFGM